MVTTRRLCRHNAILRSHAPPPPPPPWGRTSRCSRSSSTPLTVARSMSSPRGRTAARPTRRSTSSAAPRSQPPPYRPSESGEYTFEVRTTSSHPHQKHVLGCVIVVFFISKNRWRPLSMNWPIRYRLFASPCALSILKAPYFPRRPPARRLTIPSVPVSMVAGAPPRPRVSSHTTDSKGGLKAPSQPWRRLRTPPPTSTWTTTSGCIRSGRRPRRTPWQPGPDPLLRTVPPPPVPRPPSPWAVAVGCVAGGGSCPRRRPLGPVLADLIRVVWRCRVSGDGVKRMVDDCGRLDYLFFSRPTKPETGDETGDGTQNRFDPRTSPPGASVRAATEAWKTLGESASVEDPLPSPPIPRVPGGAFEGT